MGKRFAVNALALLAVSAVASKACAGYFQDGNALNDLCTNGSAGARMLLRGYAIAIADDQAGGIAIVDDATGASVMPRQFICLPLGVSSRQVEDVACNYLAAHPENRQMQGPAILFNALVAAWPCPRK